MKRVGLFRHTELLDYGGLYADMWSQQQTTATDATDAVHKPDVDLVTHVSGKEP